MVKIQIVYNGRVIKETVEYNQAVDYLRDYLSKATDQEYRLIEVEHKGTDLVAFINKWRDLLVLRLILIVESNDTNSRIR